MLLPLIERWRSGGRSDFKGHDKSYSPMGYSAHVCWRHEKDKVRGD
jgi:hypothetical protein